jgi:hypothetical protein
MYTGSPDGVTLLEFEPIEEGVPLEVQPQEVQEDEGQAAALLECPNHQPSTFLKGKL